MKRRDLLLGVASAAAVPVTGAAAYGLSPELDARAWSNPRRLAELRAVLARPRPMREFDPDRPARVYDSLNQYVFEWQPDRFAAEYRAFATVHGDEVNWDGLMLAGWEPMA